MGPAAANEGRGSKGGSARGETGEGSDPRISRLGVWRGRAKYRVWVGGVEFGKTKVQAP